MTLSGNAAAHFVGLIYSLCLIAVRTGIGLWLIHRIDSPQLDSERSLMRGDCNHTTLTNLLWSLSVYVCLYALANESIDNLQLIRSHLDRLAVVMVSASSFRVLICHCDANQIEPFRASIGPCPSWTDQCEWAHLPAISYQSLRCTELMGQLLTTVLSFHYAGAPLEWATSH